MKLSIVIVSWNTATLLANCLNSFIETLGEQDEVLVVDNASHDDTVEMVRARFPGVQLIQNRENVGFARANNQAIQKSKGQYVLLLNPDTVLTPGVLESLISFMDLHPQAGATGARLINHDSTLQQSCHPAPTLLRELWRLFHLDALYPYAEYEMAKWALDTPREVDALQGACLLLRRKALNRVGLLDETFFMYSEEVDLCWRLRQEGWSLHWVPQAQVVHFGGQSTRQVADEMFLRLYQGKIHYFRKRNQAQGAAVYKLIVLAAALIRLALTPLAYLERPSRRQRHLTLANQYQQLLFKLHTF